MSGNDALAGSLGSEGVPYTRVAFLDPFTICVNIEGASSDMPGSVDTSQLTCASTGALGVHVCGATLKDAVLGSAVMSDVEASARFDWLASQLGIVQGKLGALVGGTD